MFQYDSKNAETAWEAGNYPAVFKGAIDGVSKSTGNEMQTWTFEVFDNRNDRKQVIKEYVTASSLFKVRQLAQALGKSEDFKANNFYPEDHAGANVLVELKIEQQDGFDDKNRIVKILPPPVARPTTLPTATTRRRQTNSEKILNAQPKAQDVESPVIADVDIPF
jgi:hypothetical protein